MSTESASKTSGPPPASSWAAPPEFYADENAVTRSVLRLLRGLGYVIHTPSELYGSRDAALGAVDDDWLARIGARRLACLTRGLALYYRPRALGPHRAHPIHAFPRPRLATPDQRTV